MKVLASILMINLSIMAIAAPPLTSQIRIESEKDPAITCSGLRFSEAFCQKKRSNALANNCITKEQFDNLSKYRSSPICDVTEEDIPYMSGWCPCESFEAESGISRWKE